MAVIISHENVYLCSESDIQKLKNARSKVEQSKQEDKSRLRGFLYELEDQIIQRSRLIMKADYTT